MSIFEITREYYFKRVHPEHYEVALFLGTKRPLNIYTVKRMQCNCLGFLRARHCKHIDMIRQWISAGRPLPSVFNIN